MTAMSELRREKRTRVYEGVLSLVIAAVGLVCIVVAIISTLSRSIILEFFDVVSETHVE